MTQTMPPRPPTWTPMVVTQLVVVLAVLLSGVVGAGSLRSQKAGDGDVLEVVSAASSSAVAEKTFRATFAFDVDGEGLKVSTTGEMLIDIERKVQSGSFTAPGIGKLDFVQVGSTAYMRVPGGRTAPGGQHWYGFTSEGVESFGSQDPLEFLRLLGDADDVRKVGAEDVNGIATTHYSVGLDPERLAGLAPQGSSSLPPGALDQLKDASADVWVDEDNLPRRMRMAMSIQKIALRFTFEFLDYGKPVVVTAPPASDVLEVGSAAEIGALLGQGMTKS